MPPVKRRSDRTHVGKNDVKRPKIKGADTQLSDGKDKTAIVNVDGDQTKGTGETEKMAEQNLGSSNEEEVLSLIHISEPTRH